MFIIKPLLIIVSVFCVHMLVFSLYFSSSSFSSSAVVLVIIIVICFYWVYLEVFYWS